MATPDAVPPPPRRLHPIRVLVVTPDRRFQRAATVLLAHSGCEVEAVQSVHAMVDAVNRQSSHVVVLDATASVANAVRAIAAADAFSMPVEVVLVADAPDEISTRALRVHQKWNGEELVAEVERAYAGTRVGGRGTLALG